MLKSILTSAFRHLVRYRTYTLINIIGLTVGLACCLVILLVIRHELRYDQHHEHADRIFRVISATKSQGDDFVWNPGNTGLVGPQMKETFPQVEAYTRIQPHRVQVRLGENILTNQLHVLTDPSVLDVFTFPLILGNKSNAFDKPWSILISARLAQKTFGEENPLGKTITVDDRLLGSDYTIAGVFENSPTSASYPLQPDLLSTSGKERPVLRSAWGKHLLLHVSWRPVQHYVLLRKDASPSDIRPSLPAFIVRTTGWKENAQYDLQPLTRIHLHARSDYNLPSPGDMKNVWLLIAVALSVLIIACLNFINLSTATFAQRAKEVGIRKVSGATRRQLIPQFLTESICISCASFLVAITLTELCIPYLADLVERPIVLQHDLTTVLYIGALSIVIGLLSGIYPATFLSSFQPAYVLKGCILSNGPGDRLRKNLVTFQFAVSIVLMIATLVLKEQTAFLQNKNLGFEQDNILMMDIVSKNPTLNGKQDIIKEAFSRHPNVITTAFTITNTFIRENRSRTQPEGIAGGMEMSVVVIDEDFLNLMGVKMLAGRNFSKTVASDSVEAIILNETAVRHLGWDKQGSNSLDGAIGKTFGWQGGVHRTGRVIGVAEDFHVGSLHQAITPTFMGIRRDKLFNLFVKIRPESLTETMPFLKTTWKKFVPNRPFEPRFLDEELNHLYASEKQLSRWFTFFFALTISIACMGLFAFAAFTVERRFKEIGVRKVVGASATNIFILLARGFLWPIFIANLIAWPIAYYLLSQWLADFPYRVDLQFSSFLGVGFMAVLIALIAVAHQSYRASQINPVDVLKYE